MVEMFDAPIAKHDLDEFGDFQSIDTINSNFNEDLLNDNRSYDDLNPLHDASMHASLENLVSSFDETISKCFKSSEEKLDSLSPIYGSTPENAIFDKSQIWYKITGNLGNIVPLDWSKTRIYQLHTASLHLPDKEDSENQNLDLPDDEDLIAAFDHHSLITPRLPDALGPIQSADEIIDEIDQIMGEDDLDTPTDMRRNVAEECDLLQFRSTLAVRPANWEEELEKLSIRHLNEYLEDLEASIRDYSAVLVQQLALREELEFEKEQRDVFVSLVHGIQKQLEARGLPGTTTSGVQRNRSSNKKGGGGARTRQSQQPQSTATDAESAYQSQYLTTTIPYHQGNGSPDSELLQIFNDILNAMLSGNPQVSTLLTDYILNVYAPADNISMRPLPI